MKSHPAAGRRLSFNATLQNWVEGMDYCAVAVPADITEALGTRRAVQVSATVNDSEPFQVSLFPVGGGRHFIRIKAKVRREVDIQVGDPVRVVIDLLDRLATEIPDDLRAALVAGQLTEAFDLCPLGQRNFLIRRIGESVKQATRDKRIQEGLAAVQRRARQLSRT